MLKPTIGILAGMGPKSTGPFIDQVISQYQKITGAKDDIDFPPIIIYSLPTPFYPDRSIDHLLMEKTICEGLKRLEDCDVAFIAIPCNMAHIYYDSLKKSISVPLLNIVETTVKEIPSDAKNIAIIGTRSTLDSHLFQNKIKQRRMSYVSSERWQEIVDELICKIKSGKDQEQLLSLWEILSKELYRDRVDTILLVCTDLNILFNKVSISFRLVDSSLCLAKAIVFQYQKETFKKN